MSPDKVNSVHFRTPPGEAIHPARRVGIVPRRRPEPFPRALRIFALLLLFLLLPILHSAAPGQTRVNSWTTRDGLPQNSVRTIVQAPDGYLWLGTFEGLVRFDGVNFKVFNNVNTPQMSSNFIESLIVDRRGDLWIGIDGGGLLRRTGGRFVRYTRADGLPGENVMSLLEGGDGSVWIGTDGGGLGVFRNGRLEKIAPPEDADFRHVRALAEDDEGTLWIGTERGLFGLRDGRLAAFGETQELRQNNVSALAWSPADGLWIGTGDGLRLLRDGRLQDFPGERTLRGKIVQTLLADREGGLWIGTTTGLYRRPLNGEPETDADFAEPPDSYIEAIYQGPDGTIWIGTVLGGLSQLREGRFRTYGLSDGLPGEMVRSVYGDRAGDLWFSTRDKLGRFRGGAVVEVFSERETGLSYVSGITADADGNLWLGGPGLAVYRDGRFVSPEGAEAEEAPDARIYTLHGDRAGNIWIGTTQGLYQYRDGRFSRFTTEDGLVHDFIISLHATRDGALWIGTRHGLSRYADGRFENWTTRNGLGSDHILTFHEDDAGTLWIGTSGGGLHRYKDGRLAVVTSREGLYDNLTFRILEDGRGNFWMCGNRGVYRAAAADLNAVADGRRKKLESYSYGAADGMLNRECNGASPAGWRTDDGMLWFPTVRGLVRIDPRPLNTKPPAVIIEEARLDGETVTDPASIEVTPEHDNLEISYTGINWTRPQKIRFRYRLEGLDTDWTDAGTRRTAYFPHLPAGEYTFRVIADNGDGVWNTEGESLRITVLPPFYLTGWFLALCALVFTALVLAVYRARVNRLKRRHVRQEKYSRRLIAAHESERRRIAAELHDGLGQTLAMIKNQAVFATQIAKGPDEAEEQFEQIAEHTAHAIKEVREISYNLRPHLLDRLGLTRSLRSLFDKTADSGGIEFVTEVEDVDGLFSKEDEINVYRIVQENLNNILKHAEARRVEASVRRNGDSVVIRIRDDGKGFSTERIVNKHKKSGFGLIGIAERVKIFDGTYRVTSAPGRGTDVSIRLRTGVNGNNHQNHEETH